jgi:hypothetical protein
MPARYEAVYSAIKASFTVPAPKILNLAPVRRMIPAEVAKEGFEA